MNLQPTIASSAYNLQIHLRKFNLLFYYDEDFSAPRFYLLINSVFFDVSVKITNSLKAYWWDLLPPKLKIKRKNLGPDGSRFWSYKNQRRSSISLHLFIKAPTVKTNKQDYNLSRLARKKVKSLTEIKGNQLQLIRWLIGLNWRLVQNNGFRFKDCKWSCEWSCNEHGKSAHEKFLHY